MNEHVHPIFAPILNAIFHGAPTECGCECIQCGVAISRPTNSTEDGGALCVACTEKDEETDEKLRPGSGDPSHGYIEAADREREMREARDPMFKRPGEGDDYSEPRHESDPPRDWMGGL